MVDEVITKQELIDAQKDAQSLDEFINGGDEQIVVTRLLKEYPTLANAIRQIYEKGGKFYPTLAAANADIANIRTDVYVITGDDGAYYKATAGATTLTKSPYDPLTQAKADATAKADAAKIEAIATAATNTNSAISDFSDTFLDGSNNLFDASAATIGKFVNVGGVLSPNLDHAVSNFIPVEQNKVYTVSASVSPAFNAVIFYDVNSSFISFLSLTSPTVVNNFTTPTGTTHIRLNIYDALPTDGDRMLNKGSVALPYEPYKPMELKADILSDNLMKYLADNLTPNKSLDDGRGLEYYLQSEGVNLFNPYNTIAGEYISSQGVPTKDVSYSRTELIPVESNQVYSIKGVDGKSPFITMSFYDKDKVFLRVFNSKTHDLPKSEKSFTIPSDVKYVVLNMNQGYPWEFDRMFNKGEVKPYEPFIPTILKNAALSDTTKGGLKRELTPNNLDSNHVVKSANLFDPKKALKGGYINPYGEYVVSAAHSVSELMPVTAGKKYSLTSLQSSGNVTVNIAFYGFDRIFLYRVNTAIDYHLTKETITIPNEVAYAQLIFKVNNPENHDVMFYLGDTLVPYTPYEIPKLVGIDVDVPEIENISFIQPNNLFDYDKVTLGGYVSSVGVWTDDVNYATSDYISVTPNTEYTISGAIGKDAFIRTVFYGANKEFIQSVSTRTFDSVDGAKTILIPENVFYVRLLMNQGSPSEHKRMFSKGSTKPTYDTGKVLVENINVDKAVLQSNKIDSRVGDWIAYTGDRHPAVLLDFPESFSKDDARNISTGNSPVTYADMIGWWQELTDEFPDYITKKKIGVDSSGTLDVHSYTFMPKNLTNQGVSNHPKQQRPRVLMIVQHIEQMNQLYPLFAMRELCRKWHTDPLLAALRLEVEFVVIPYTHPYGFGNNYRLTADGLNTNGDWPLNWSHVTNPLNGDAPFATQEARNVKAVVEDFKPHVMFDLHSAFGTADRHGVWIDAEPNGRFVNSTYCALTSMYPKLKAKFPDYADIDKLLLVTYSNAARQAPGYMYAVGATGGLIEMMKNRGDRLASDGIYNDTLVFASSMLLNITSECIAEYRDYGRPNKGELYNGTGIYYADLNKP